MRSGIQWQSFVLLPVGLLVGLAQPADLTSLSIKDLIAHGDQYHQHMVSVVGTAEEIKTLSGPRNLPFYTFVLRDPVASADVVTVLMQGKPEVSNGDHVLVHGIFIKLRKAGRSTITNRIEATIVKQLHDQRQPLIG